MNACTATATMLVHRVRNRTNRWEVIHVCRYLMRKRVRRMKLRELRRVGYECCRLVDSQRCSKTFRVASEDTQVILHIVCNSLFRWYTRTAFLSRVSFRFADDPGSTVPFCFSSRSRKRTLPHFPFSYEHKLQELDSWQSCSDIRGTKQWIFIVCIWHLHDTVSRLPLLPATISARTNLKIEKRSRHHATFFEPSKKGNTFDG